MEQQEVNNLTAPMNISSNGNSIVAEIGESDHFQHPNQIQDTLLLSSTTPNGSELSDQKSQSLDKRNQEELKQDSEMDKKKISSDNQITVELVQGLPIDQNSHLISAQNNQNTSGAVQEVPPQQSQHRSSESSEPSSTSSDDEKSKQEDDDSDSESNQRIKQEIQNKNQNGKSDNDDNETLSNNNASNSKKFQEDPDSDDEKQAIAQSQKEKEEELKQNDEVQQQRKSEESDDEEEEEEEDEEDEPTISQSSMVVETSPKDRFKRFAEELGRGAYKIVYRGVDHETGREIAWNVINLRRLPRQDRVRIKSEIDLIKKLQHKNIIHFISAWINKQKEQVIFITEMITGGSLRKYVKKIKHPRLKVIKGWCSEILQGLIYLHGQEPHPIIHRDLKCDNIFINSNSGEIRIGDLGLSTPMQHSFTTSVLGTPEFMAPELYEECYGTGVDIYAFGMCVLEMVTLERPYKECQNPAQIYNKVIQGIRPKAMERIEDTEVQDFILQCLKRADQRPTAQELLESRFIQDLENEKNNLEVKVKPPAKQKVPKKKKEPKYQKQGSTILEEEEENNTDEDNTKPKIQAPLQSASVSQSQSVNLSQKQDIPSSSSQQSQMTNEQIKPTSKTSSPNILQKSKMTNILNEDSTPKNDDSVKSALRETLEGQKKGVSSASNVSQKSNKSSPTIEKEKKNTQGQQKIEIKQLDENAKAIVKKGEDDENNEDLKSGSNSNNSMLNNSQNKKKKRNSGSRIKKLDESVSFLKEIDKKKQQKLQERSMANQEPLYQTNIIGQDGVEDEEEDDSTQDKNTENILDELKKDDPQWIEEQQQQQMIFLQQQLQLQQAANATKDKEKNEKLQQQKKQQNPQPTPQQALDHHQQMLDKKKKENMNALLIEKKKNFKEDEPFVTKETPQQQANNSHAPTSGLQTQNSVKDMNQLLQSTNVNSRNSHKKIALANDKDNKSGGPMLQPSHNAEPIGYALKRVSSRDQMVGQQNQLGNEDNPINQQNRMQAIMQPSQSHQNVKLPTQHNSQYIQLTSSLNNENNATSGGVLNRKNANQQNNYSDGMLQNQVQALSNQQTNTAQSTRNNNLDLLANTVNQLEHSQEFDNQSSNPHSDTDENNSDLIIQHKGMNYMDDRGGNNQQHEYQGQPQGMLTPQFETPHTSNGQLKQNHQEYSSSRNLNLGNQTASNNQLGGDQLVHQNSSSYIQQFNHQHQQLAPQNSTLQQQSTQQNNPSTQQNQSNLQVLQTGTSKPQTNKNTDYQLQQNQQQQQLQSQKNQVNNQISSSIQQQQQTQQKLGQQTQQVATQNQQQQKVQPKKLELTKEQSVKAGASSSTHQRPPPSIQQQQLQDLCSAVAFYQSNDSKRLNMTIKIKTPDNGPEKEVTFDFDIRSDTPVGVSQEMVKELQLPSYYIDLIQKKIQSLCQRMQIQGSTPQNQEHRTGGGGTGTGQHGQQQSITNQQQLQQQTTQQQNNLANNNKSGGKSVSNVNQTSQQVINKQKISPTKISKDSAINHFNKLFEGIDGFFQVLQGKGIESLEEVIDAMESTEDEKCFKIEFLNSVYQAKKKYKVKMEEVNKKRQQLIDTKKKVAVSQSAQLLDHSLSSGLVTGTPQNSYASGSVNSGNIQHIQGFGAQSQSSTTTNSKQSMTKQSSTTPAHLIHEQFYYQQHSQQNNNLNNGSNSVTQQSTTHLTPINQSSSQQKRNATSNQGRNDFSQASSSAHTSFKQSSAHNEQNAQNSNYTYSEPNTLANDQFFNQNVPKSDNNITLRTSDKSQSAQQSQKQQTPSTNSQLSSQAKKTLIHLPSRLSGDLYKGNPDMAEEDIINLQNVLSIICTASLQQQWQQQNPGQDSSSITFNHPQLKFDGNFGEKTEKLIIKFQESAGMNPDGIVNEQLWKKLTHCVDKLQSGGKFQIQPSQQQKEQKWTVQQPQHNTTGKSQHQLQQQQQLQPIQTKEKQQSNYNTQLQQQQHQQQQHQQQVTQLTSKQQPPHSPYLYHNKISPLKIQNQASSQSHRQVYSNKDEELEDADYELVMQEVFKGQQDNNGGGNGAGQYY